MSREKLKLTEELIEAIVYDEDLDSFELISEEINDTSRWSIHITVVFKYNNRFWRTFYSKGATEYQDESPYENDDKVAYEVFPVEKVVTCYE